MALLLVLPSISGCAGNEEQFAAGQTEQVIYNKARRLLEKKRYDLAAQYLEALEKEFPFGPYAEQAQLELIYAYFRSYQFDEAIERAQRFITLHPDHPERDYAHYLMGLATYSNSQNLLTRFFEVDFSSRDVSGARESLKIFREMVVLFPDSEYVEDVLQRMKFLRNILARKEIMVANAYLAQSAWLAAANRGAFVVQHYQNTPAIADALAVMTYAYQQLELDDLASSTRRVLEMNYPDFPAFDSDGSFRPAPLREKKSLATKLTLGMIPSPQIMFDSRTTHSKQ